MWGFNFYIPGKVVKVLNMHHLMASSRSQLNQK